MHLWFYTFGTIRNDTAAADDAAATTDAYKLDKDGNGTAK